MIDFLQNSCRFFSHESCGQCTPCREGTSWATKMLTRIKAGKGRVKDLDLHAEIGGTIGITRKEVRQNSGEAQILSLLEAKIKQAEMQMRETLNTQLIQGTVSSSTFVPGNSAKDLNPLGWFLRKANATDPTTGGNVGNIAGATYSWWRHKTAVADSGSTDTGNSLALSAQHVCGPQGRAEADVQHCSRGSGGNPNLIVGDQTTFETYENALDTQVRYTNTRLADMGFDNIKLRNATMIWDELVPSIDTGEAAGGATFTGTAFLLNTNFYKLIIDSQTDIVTTPFVEPENQNVKIAKILFMGNAVCSNLRKQGVVYAISQSIAS